jgi:tetratricopeptide (TPR) repeat protein
MPKKNSAQSLLQEALQAGVDRDYLKAIEILTLLIAEDDPPPEALLYLGRSYQAMGSNGKAVSALRAYLREGGDPAAGYFFLGRAYLSSGQAEEAIAALRKSIEASGESPAAWALLGAAYLKAKRSKSAADCLEHAVSLAPGDTRIFRGYLNALFARAVRLLLHGDADMARQMLGFVIENGLDNPATRLWRAKAFRELNRPKEALVDCEATLAHSPDDPSLLWLRAGLLLQAGRQKEALEEFNRLCVEYPDLPGLPQDERGFARLRASLAFREERWKEAAETALDLLKAEPKDAPLRALAAESLRALGQTERAKSHFERAIEADPNSPDLRLGLSLTLWELGDYEGARNSASRAGRLGAADEEVDYYLALCDARLGADPDRLLPRLQSLVKARGADPHLMFALGETLYRAGRPDLAGTWFKKVLSLVPDHELSLLYSISVAESLEDEAATLEADEAYLEEYPDNEAIRHEYLSRLMKAGAWEKAAAAIEGGLVYENGVHIQRRLALAYRNLGRYREAAIVYRDLLRADPSNSELLLSLVLCLDRDGKGDYALALLEKAPAAMKKTAGTSIILGRLYARKNKMEAAVDALRLATEIEPKNARAWRDLGALYKRQGLIEFSASCLERAEQLEPSPKAQARAREKEESSTIPRPKRPSQARKKG